MSDGKRSFWSSIPGLITGLAGLLTGVVGLITLLVQQGVIGHSGDSSSSGTTTTVAGAPAGASSTVVGGGGFATPGTERGRFSVNPTALTLQSSDRQKALTVRNLGATTITLLAPDFSGPDKDVFRADATCTNVPVKPGDSCTFNVLFTPSGILKAYSAIVTVRASGLDPTPVPIDVRAGL